MKQFEIVMQKLINSNTIASFFGGDLNIRDEEVKSVFDGMSNLNDENSSEKENLSAKNIQHRCKDVFVLAGKPKEGEYSWDTTINHNLNIQFKSRLRFDRIYTSSSLFPTDPIQITSFQLIGTKKLENSHLYPSDHFGVCFDATVDCKVSLAVDYDPLKSPIFLKHDNDVSIPDKYFLCLLKII
jgi:hypothetical protein